MKVLFVLGFDVPDDKPEIIPDIIARIDPPALPFFDRTLHVVVPPHAAELEAWLDEE